MAVLELPRQRRSWKLGSSAHARGNLLSGFQGGGQVAEHPGTLGTLQPEEHMGSLGPEQTFETMKAGSRLGG